MATTPKLDAGGFGVPTPEELQHWTAVAWRAQRMILDHVTRSAGTKPLMPDMTRLFATWSMPRVEPQAMLAAQAGLWRDGLAMWQRLLDPAAPSGSPAEPADDGTPDRGHHSGAPAWREHPAFALVGQVYAMISDMLLAQVDGVAGVSDHQREQLRFATRAYLDAASPANFAVTNPEVLERIVATRGESALKGLENLLADLGRGQLSHVAPGAFELGRDIAATPGKVILETDLFQLIQYAPTGPTVQRTPLVIFPPWINRFYILDLGPKKSFVGWAVAQGLTVFMVSWKSADASLAETTLDDYVSAQLDAMQAVRDLLDTDSVHAIGYCVAGTVLAATLALLAARGGADTVASATFFTAQVDFEHAGDLALLASDAMIDLAGALAGDTGFLDGRYMAATFNMLRGRDLIWNYVVRHYLMGEPYPAFDLLYWNGDTTNLPAKWHGAYLKDFYRDNLLVRAGGISVLDTPIDLARVTTPSYVQAGREDHIAPAESVWKITEHFRGPLRFVLAGSGHVAGVVNPPHAGKYAFWTSAEGGERPAGSLAEFTARARETKGSWWPDWIAWITARSGGDVPADGARVPGGGALPAIEDAPGRYVRIR